MDTKTYVYVALLNQNAENAFVAVRQLDADAVLEFEKFAPGGREIHSILTNHSLDRMLDTTDAVKTWAAAYIDFDFESQTFCLCDEKSETDDFEFKNLADAYQSAIDYLIQYNNLDEPSTDVLHLLETPHATRYYVYNHYDSDESRSSDLVVSVQVEDWASSQSVGAMWEAGASALECALAAGDEVNASQLRYQADLRAIA